MLSPLAHAERRDTHAARWALLIVALWPVAVLGKDRKAGYIENLEVLATYDAYGGMPFGEVGPYQ